MKVRPSTVSGLGWTFGGLSFGFNVWAGITSNPVASIFGLMLLFVFLGYITRDLLDPTAEARTRLIVAKDEDGEVLVTLWDDGEVEVAWRQDASDIWGPPLEIREDVSE